VPQETSGGISIIGSIGAMVGSFAIVLLGIGCVEISYIRYVILISFPVLPVFFLIILLKSMINF
jgi:uncharacterized membrane protein